MKKTFIKIVCSLCVMVFFISCGPNSEDAANYADAIASQQSLVFDKESALIDAISKNTPEKFDTLYTKLKEQLNKSTDFVKAMKDFDGSDEMKDAALKVFSAYKVIIENDYPEIIRLEKTPDTLYTQEIDDKVIDISKKIDDKLNKTIDAFVDKQNEFSEKYKFELSETEKKQ